MELINPCCDDTEGEELGVEGCLSIPGEYGEVPRASKIIVTALDREGRKVRIEAEGLLARILQLVDIYDALRTARPYKTALTSGDACEQLRREARQGWLDLGLLENFLAHHDSLIEDSWPAA